MMSESFSSPQQSGLAPHDPSNPVSSEPAPSTPHSHLATTPQPAEAAIRARGLYKTYGSDANTVTALDGVDLDLERGRFTAIMGPSGSGKSTLLHVLAGLDTPSAGSILLGDTDITTLRDKALTTLRRDRIGFVFQSFNLLPMLTAEQNILLPLDLAGRRVDQSWFTTIVEALGLQDRLRHVPAQLSGGQVQRVAIARALVTSPDVIFADEPTGNLDSHATQSVLDFLRLSVDEFQQTVVMVTHERDAAENADRIISLLDGQIDSDERAPFTAGDHR